MIKKMMLLAISLVAFAVPATAGATVFTHEGEAVSEPVNVEWTGTTAYATDGGGVHCNNVHVLAALEPEGHGWVTSFTGTECVTNEGFPIHPTAKALPWTIEALPGNKGEITGVSLHTSVRHPLNTNLEIGTNVFGGDEMLTLGEGGAASLSNGAAGMKMNGWLPVTIHGSLTNGGTGIGTE